MYEDLYEKIFFNSFEMKILHFRIPILVSLLVFTFGVMRVGAYSYSGIKWGGTSASYSINNAFAASFRTAMQAADAAWDAAGSVFRFNYLGTTTRNPNTFSYSLDGHSDIGYVNQGNNGIVAQTAGGVTTPGGTTISERDTTFNIYYGLTTVGASGSYDVQNVMTHEFGHWLKLLDVSSSLSPTWCGFSFESTMCNVTTPNETRKRSLEGDDKNGIKFIYGV